VDRHRQETVVDRVAIEAAGDAVRRHDENPGRAYFCSSASTS
jgi:hypothetical protein